MGVDGLLFTDKIGENKVKENFFFLIIDVRLLI